MCKCHMSMLACSNACLKQLLKLPGGGHHAGHADAGRCGRPHRPPCPLAGLGSGFWIPQNPEPFQVAGIMLGMLTLGVVADRIGRRAGSLACAAFMLGGGVMLACAVGPTLEAWALMFAVSQVTSAPAPMPWWTTGLR